MPAVRDREKFAEWKRRVDQLLRERTHASWADLCGDEEPLERGFDRDDTPEDFVQWWIDKYDLMTADTDPWSFGRP